MKLVFLNRAVLEIVRRCPKIEVRQNSSTAWNFSAVQNFLLLSSLRAIQNRAVWGVSTNARMFVAFPIFNFLITCRHLLYWLWVAPCIEEEEEEESTDQ